MKRLKIIELFAGIGGIGLGFKNVGCKCVWANDLDKFCKFTYEKNFPSIPFILGDIRGIDSSEIPDFDILCAGFPCQPFSLGGVTKNNSLNKPHGFADKTRGTLFYEIVRILSDKRPRAFLLENVKHLLNHNLGETFNVIKQTFAQLGYSFNHAVINSNLLVPQKRERLYMIGFKENNSNFRFPEISDVKPKIKEILEDQIPEKYVITNNLWTYLKKYKKRHIKKGNGFGYGCVDFNGQSRTLSARYYKDGSEILIPVDSRNPRRLTPRECARLQGFPDSFKIPVSDCQAYKQFGNSVTVPIIEKLAKSLVDSLIKN